MNMALVMSPARSVGPGGYSSERRSVVLPPRDLVQVLLVLVLVRGRLRTIQRRPDLINALLGQTGLTLDLWLRH